MQNRVTGREPAVEVTAVIESVRDPGGDFAEAVADVERAMGADAPGSQAWRWKVRRSLAGVRDLLEEESWEIGGWLAARAAVGRRNRTALLDRVVVLGGRVLQDPDVDRVVVDVRTLLADVLRHGQRAHDLAYDEVEGELGGSE